MVKCNSIPDNSSKYPKKLYWRNKRKHVLLFIEFVLSFFVLPATIYLKLLPLPKFSVLIALSFFASIVVLTNRNIHKNQLFTFHISRDLLRLLLIRFLLFIPFIISLTVLLAPDLLFKFPQKEPLKWGLTAILYPVFSALPQEILYRVFFFNRYQSIFKKKPHFF